MKKALLFFLSLILFFTLGCDRDEAVEEKAIDPANFDTTLTAGDDFYLYANGGWMKNNPIPDEYSRYGVFEILAEKNRKQLQTIIDEAISANAKHGSTSQKVGDFYRVGMDTVAVEKAGLTVISAELDRVTAITNINELEREFATLHKNGIRTIFSFSAGQDEKNSEMNIAQIRQAGISLPDRGYYLNEDARSLEIRTEYVKHLTKMFGFLGEDEVGSKKSAETVMRMETRFAENSMTRLERRDPHKVYNKMPMEKLADLGEGFDWKGWFTNVGKSDPGEINVQQTHYITALGQMINDIPIDDWKVYLHWKVINSAAPYLNKAVVEQDFAFYGKVLSGRKVNRPRWKRVQRATNAALGEAVGELYVARYFPPRAKKRMQVLVENLRKALQNRIENLTWMSPETKKKALEKLGTIFVKIGYPDKWIDYTNLDIQTDSYFDNVRRGRTFSFNRTLDKVNNPVDRDEWFMNPQTVNAYYNPNSNEIVFPAAILQPPFFFMNADDAVNYGAIGLVIGHEMTHGFDDQGRQYDKDGNLRDWWTEEDAKKFDKAAQKWVTAYDEFPILDTLHVDGKLTLGENIADLGGIAVSFDAMQMALKGEKRELIDGFTPEQRFFLSYAQVWRQNIRPKALMRRLKEDVHSPGHARVVVPLRHINYFYEAFDVQPGQGMYVEPENRVVIW